MNLSVALILVLTQTPVDELTLLRSHCPSLELPNVDTETLRATPTPAKVKPAHRHLLRWGNVVLMPGPAPLSLGSGRYAHDSTESFLEVTEPGCLRLQFSLGTSTGRWFSTVSNDLDAPPDDLKRVLKSLGLVEVQTKHMADLLARTLRAEGLANRDVAGNVFGFDTLPGALVAQRPSTFSEHGLTFVFAGADLGKKPLRVGGFELTPVKVRSEFGELTAIHHVASNRTGFFPEIITEARPLADDAVLVHQAIGACGGTPCGGKWLVVTLGRMLALDADAVSVTRGELVIANEDQHGELVWNPKPVPWRTLLKHP